MNIVIQLVEKPVPNNETEQAISDVESNNGIEVKDSKELFSLLGI